MSEEEENEEETSEEEENEEETSEEEENEEEDSDDGDPSKSEGLYPRFFYFLLFFFLFEFMFIVLLVSLFFFFFLFFCCLNRFIVLIVLVSVALVEASLAVDSSNDGDAGSADEKPKGMKMEMQEPQSLLGQFLDFNNPTGTEVVEE